MLIIALTGGIGCGKSTVTRLFANKSVPIVDADEIAHTIVQTGQPALALLTEKFGPQILLANGALNRDYLRDIVFNNPEEKKALESILHPIIYQHMFQQLATFSAPYGILSIPLLFETSHQHKADRILVIDCPEQLQIERVKSRDQLSDSMIGSIMASQVSRAFRLEHADDIINNNQSIESLECSVQTLHDRYLKMSAGKN